MKIAKGYTFDSAHILPRHQGKCGRLHGHTYNVSIVIQDSVKKDTQFVLDYAELDVLMKPLIDKLDHNLLNLYIKYPSAENIATYLANFVSLKIKFDELQVTVSETPKTIAVWSSLDDKDVRRLHDDHDIEWKPPLNIELVQVLKDVNEYINQKILRDFV